MLERKNCCQLGRLAALAKCGSQAPKSTKTNSGVEFPKCEVAEHSKKSFLCQDENTAVGYDLGV